MHPILALILRRLALSGLILLLAVIVVFVGTEILPGDALDSAIPQDERVYFTEEDFARMRAELGLDRPVLVRFGEMLYNLITFDFGKTLVTRDPVIDNIWHPMLNSLLMASIAIVHTPLVAIALGISAALKPGGRLDGIVSGAIRFSYSMPDLNDGPPSCAGRKQDLY